MLLIVFIVMGNATAQELENEKRYKSWTLKCFKQEKSTPSNCLLMQTIVLKETNSRLLQMAIDKQEKQVAGRLTVPLGVFLPNGLTLQIDKGEKTSFPLLHCDQQGCHTTIRLNKDLIAGLKAGKQLTVTFSDMTQRSIGVPVSLQGFTLGFNHLK